MALAQLAGKEERLKFSLLRPDLAQILEVTRTKRALSGFVLVGDAAMTLRTGVRLSSDLTFACLSNTLPRVRISYWQGGHKKPCKPLVLEGHAQRYREAGYDITDFQQRILIDGVSEVAFYVPDAVSRKILGADDNRAEEKPVRVATLEELFALTVLALAYRSKSSDLLDLYLLMKDHGFSLDDAEALFQSMDAEEIFSRAMANIKDFTPDEGDTGIDRLMEKSPLPWEIRKFLSDKVVAWQMGPLQKLR